MDSGGGWISMGCGCGWLCSVGGSVAEIIGALSEKDVSPLE
jgi:hypothetical protein